MAISRRQIQLLSQNYGYILETKVVEMGFLSQSYGYITLENVTEMGWESQLYIMEQMPLR